MVNQIPGMFLALSDRTRFEIVAALRRGPRNAGELAEICGASPPSMSRHLRVLRRAHMVEVVASPDTDHDARYRVYQLRPEGFHSMAEWVAHMQGFWSEQLAGFKAHAEKRQSRNPSGRGTRKRRST